MNKERYKEIAERNKNNSLMLCYEVFCEEKKQIPLNIFQEYFPIWIASMDIHSAMFGIDNSLSKIVEFLNKKYA